MSRLSCVVLPLLLAAFVPGGEEMPRADLYGDPLPDGVRVRCGTVRLRAGFDRPSAEFSRDGKTLRTTADGQVAFWDVATGKRLKTLALDEGVLHATALSPDGKLLAGVGSKGAYLWDAETHRLVRHLPGGSGDAVLFTADGKSLVTGGATVALWDVATGKERRKLAGHDRAVTHLARSPDGRALLSYSSSDRKVCLWSPETGAALASFQDGPFGVDVAAAFPLSDKAVLLAGFASGDKGRAGVASIRDPATGKEVRRIDGLDRAVTGAVLSADGKTLVVSEDDGPIRVFDLATGAELARWQAAARVLAVSPDGKVVAGSAGFARVHLWDAATGTPLDDRPVHDHWVTSLAFAPDGKSLAAAAGWNDVRVWDAATGQHRHRLGRRDGYGWDGVADLGDGRLLVGGADALQVHDAATGEAVAEVALAEIDNLLHVQMRPGGKTLAAIGYNIVRRREGNLVFRVADLATGRTVSNLEVVGDVEEWMLCRPALSPDGTRVVYGEGANRLLVACDVATGKNQARMQSAGASFRYPAFSPDGKVLAASATTRNGDDGLEYHVRLFDAADGKELRAVALPGPGGRLTFSPTGRTVAVAVERVLHLLDATTGKEAWRSATLDAGIGSLAFSTDGKVLAAGMGDGTVLLWDVPPQAR